MFCQFHLNHDLDWLSSFMLSFSKAGRKLEPSWLFLIVINTHIHRNALILILNVPDSVFEMWAPIAYVQPDL
jgi:hypothetical protein